jgi:hypothetical protein
MEVLGSSCLRARKFDEVREAFRKALSEWPHSRFVLYGIALSWDKQGKSEEACPGVRRQRLGRGRRRQTRRSAPLIKCPR